MTREDHGAPSGRAKGDLWQVELTRTARITVSAQTFMDAFGGEWEEAHQRGLSVDEFMRESIDIIGWDLLDDGDLQINSREDNEVTAYKLPSRTPPAEQERAS